MMVVGLLTSLCTATFVQSSENSEARKNLFAEPNIALDQVVTVPLRRHIFRMPFGYVYPRPSGPGIECVIQGNCTTEDYVKLIYVPLFGWSVGFQFWMPDKKYPLSSHNGPLTVRPKEPGRDQSDPQQYLVWIALDWIFESGYEETSDGQRLLFAQRTIKGKNNKYNYWKVIKNNEYGLDRIFENKTDEKPDALTKLYFQEEGNFLSFIRCATFGEQACEAIFWEISTGLAWRASFPTNRIEDWYTIKTISRGYISTWYVGEERAAQ